MHLRLKLCLSSFVLHIFSTYSYTDARGFPTGSDRCFCPVRYNEHSSKEWKPRQLLFAAPGTFRHGVERVVTKCIAL